MEIELTKHDSYIVEKITKLCTESTANLEKVVKSGEPIDLVELFYREWVSHIEDLVDELESAEAKATVALYVAEMKVDLDETLVGLKAIDAYRKGITQ